MEELDSDLEEMACIMAIGDVIKLHTAIHGEVDREWTTRACLQHHNFVKDF